MLALGCGCSAATLRSVVLVITLVGRSTSVAGADWPQLLGATRNGVYAAPDLADSWPKEGPSVLWQKKVGQGFSGPVVATGKLVLFHRQGDKEVVECLDASDGRPFWRFDYASAYKDDFGFDEGPRATPTIAKSNVFTFGAEGVLNCLDLATGKRVWSVDAKKAFRARKGFFGIACSPLVQGDALIINVGGSDGAGIVGFDHASGKVLWKTTDDEASYSSPTGATLDGKPCALVLTRNGLVGVDPLLGKVRFQFPFRPPMQASVTAATPLVIDDLLFISASYGTGAALLQVKGDGVEKRTSKVRWSQDRLRAGTIMLAGSRLLILTEKGELICAPATPTGFQPTARAQILSFQVRAYPALADGLFYARSKDTLVCVDLRERK